MSLVGVISNEFIMEAIGSQSSFRAELARLTSLRQQKIAYHCCDKFAEVEQFASNLQEGSHIYFTPPPDSLNKLFTFLSKYKLTNMIPDLINTFVDDYKPTHIIIDRLEAYRNEGCEYANWVKLAIALNVCDILIVTERVEEYFNEGVFVTIFINITVNA